jgi:hypothetical protein
VTRIFLASAVAAIAFASPAAAAERTFTHEGVTYHYNVTPKGDSRVLEGRASEGGRFRLVVRNGWVTGTVADSRVSFRAPRKLEATLVASR